MFAIARPVAGSEYEVGNFPQARACGPRVRCVQGEHSAGQALMAAFWPDRSAKSADSFDTVLNVIVISEIETKNYGALHRRAIDDIEPNKSAITNH